MKKEDKPYIAELRNLVCFSTARERRRYKSDILNKVFLFTRHKVIEYVDITTGEIISHESARRLGVTEYDYEPLSKERNMILNSLRKEVRHFATFLLKFRNKRRGVSPNVGVVVEWYSKYTGKRVSNITSRILPEIKGKIIHSDTLMMPPFQKVDKKATAKDHLSEDTDAENKFFALMIGRSFDVEEVQ